jgi:CRISPR system Cascade subunit CasD
MTHPYLLLWFEAPLQSWGSDSKFGRRETLNFPTKSGVLGLICSALGAGGKQAELLAEFALLHMSVISFNKSNIKGQSRVREPLMRDFHMVGSGYDDKDPWQRLLIPKKNDGSAAVGGGTKITYRYYLQDAVFAVLLEVPVNRADEIIHALQNPSWDMYLGRKCCVPTEIIYQGMFDSENVADKKAKSLSAIKKLVSSPQGRVTQ